MSKNRFLLLATALLAGSSNAVTAQTIDGFTSPGETLDTVTVNGITYDASTLINGTLSTAPGGVTDPDTVQLLVGDGNPAPAPGTRAAVIESPQLRLDTALLNITGLTFVFDTPVSNGAGIDLLIWDWGGFTGGDTFDITINGQTATGLTNDDTSLPAGGDYLGLVFSYTLTSQWYASNETTGINSVADLDSASLTFAASPNNSQASQGVIGLDLDAFGVAAGGSITELTISNGSKVDPSVILGLPPAANSTPIRITSISPLGGGNWELTFEGEALTGYEFHSSTTLDFNSGTLVENLTQDDPGSDPGTIGGTNDSVLTTAGDGKATVRMVLTGSPADFVRAQNGP